MTLRRPIICLLAAAIVTLLLSCIERREEFWIEADGSGRAEFSCTVPASAARMHGGNAGVSSLIGAFIGANPGLKNVRHEVRTEGGRTTAVVGFSFDSALDLMESGERVPMERLPGAVRHFAGAVEAEWKGLSVEITRRFDPGKALPGAALIPGSSLDGRLITIIHLPDPADFSNATRMENDGRTLVWDTPLAEAVKSPVTQRFRMKLPLPWHMLGWVAVPLAVLGGVIWVRRSAAPAASGDA